MSCKLENAVYFTTAISLGNEIARHLPLRSIERTLASA
jgi:hypothetical protein